MGRFKHLFRSINGVSLKVSGKELLKLARIPASLDHARRGRPARGPELA